MQTSQTPALIPLAFATTGAKNTIPETSQIGIVDGAASLPDGFVPLNGTPISSGGIPPTRADMNGILYMISAWSRWQSAGGGVPYNSTFASDANVGGYPKGARVLRADGTGYWLNQTENNTSNPDAGGAGWVPDVNYGVAAITGLTNANVTLSAPQYAKKIITLAGTLTANVQIIFPTIVGEWLVVNNTSGAFTLTCKTASGSGSPITQGASSVIWGDGTNIYPTLADRGTLDALYSQINSGLGEAQTWQNVTSSRALGTTYYNTTGKPIFIVAAFTTTGTTQMQLTVNSSAVNVFGFTSGSDTAYPCVIAPGESYSWTSISGPSPFIKSWTERR